PVLTSRSELPLRGEAIFCVSGQTACAWAATAYFAGPWSAPELFHESPPTFSIGSGARGLVRSGARAAALARRGFSPAPWRQDSARLARLPARDQTRRHGRARFPRGLGVCLVELFPRRIGLGLV